MGGLKYTEMLNRINCTEIKLDTCVSYTLSRKEKQSIPLKKAEQEWKGNISRKSLAQYAKRCLWELMPRKKKQTEHSDEMLGCFSP